LIFVISNDYLTSNCYECVTIFTGPEFGWLAEPIILTKNDPYGLKFSSAAFLQWLDKTLTQLGREWTSDYLPNSWLPYNPTTQWRSMRTINGDQFWQSITTQWHSILSRTLAFWLNCDITTKVPIISYLVLSFTDLSQ
jgi:hypothetical protein